MPASANLYSPQTDYLLANQMTIQELGGDELTVTLRGSGMPHVGAKWGVRQNAPITWYPGNREGSQQVLGGQVLPSDWEGTWKRTLLGKAPCLVEGYGQSTATIVLPETMVDIFERICVGGQRVRVKWRNYTREGRLTEFTHAHGKTTDVTWTMKFDWVSRGHEATARVQGVRGNSVTSDLDSVGLEAELAAAMEPTRLLVSTRPEQLPKGTPTLTLGQIGGLLNAPKKMMSDLCRASRVFAKNLQQAAALVKQARDLPASLTNSILNEAENMLAIANQTVDSLSRQSPEQLAVRTNAAAVAKNASYYGSGVRQAQVLAGRCADVRQGLQAVKADASGGGIGDNRASTQSRDVLRVHAVHQGETLVSISFLYYDSPDHAPEIAACNHVPYPCAPDAGGHSIGGKRTLIIPVLRGRSA
jgi:hypothetical protein